MKLKSGVPNLDFLRSIAVLLVVGDHVLETIGYKTAQSFHPYDWYMGRLGVLLFFVHTSLVLMWSMERCGLAGWGLVKAFYIRRMFRIYPLSIFCVLCVVIFSVPRMPYDKIALVTVGQFLSNILLTMNLTDSKPVLAPLWSLPLEMQMYVVLPGIFLFLQNRRTASPIIYLYVVGIVAGSILPEMSDRLSLAGFIPAFLGGVIAYYIHGKVTRRYPPIYWLLFLSAIIFLYFLIEDLTPGVHHRPLQWMICLLVGLGIPLFRQLNNPFLVVISHNIAKYSYGIYLFHCIAIWIGCFVLDLSSAQQWISVLLMLVIVPVICFHLIEQPAIKYGSEWARKTITIKYKNSVI